MTDTGERVSHVPAKGWFQQKNRTSRPCPGHFWDMSRTSATKLNGDFGYLCAQNGVKLIQNGNETHDPGDLRQGHCAMSTATKEELKYTFSFTQLKFHGKARRNGAQA